MPPEYLSPEQYRELAAQLAEQGCPRLAKPRKCNRRAIAAPPNVTPEEYKALVRDSWSEKQFQAEVIALAKSCGWLCHHSRPALTQEGRWTTALQGDAGFVDAVLARNGVVYFIELKVKGRKRTPKQLEWAAALPEVSATGGYRSFGPKDWSKIEELLR